MKFRHIYIHTKVRVIDTQFRRGVTSERRREEHEGRCNIGNILGVGLVMSS